VLLQQCRVALDLNFPPARELRLAGADNLLACAQFRELPQVLEEALVESIGYFWLAAGVVSKICQIVVTAQDAAPLAVFASTNCTDGSTFLASAASAEPIGLVAVGWVSPQGVTQQRAEQSPACSAPTPPSDPLPSVAKPTGRKPRP
jgi:hypothetical protein